MASNYITIVTQNERSNNLISLTREVLDVSQKTTQTKNEMDAIMGSNPVVYANLVEKYGISTEAEATALYNMIVGLKSALDAIAVTSVTKNIGL